MKIFNKKDLLFFKENESETNRLDSQRRIKVAKIEQTYKKKTQKLKDEQWELIAAKAKVIEEKLIKLTSYPLYRKILLLKGEDPEASTLAEHLSLRMCAHNVEDYLRKQRLITGSFKKFNDSVGLSDDLLDKFSLRRRDIANFCNWLDRKWNTNGNPVFYFPARDLNDPDKNYFRIAGVAITIFDAEDAEKVKYRPGKN